jgi:hypothetical protein
MDPSLFRIDWDVLIEVLTAIIVLSFFVERALSRSVTAGVKIALP